MTEYVFDHKTGPIQSSVIYGVWWGAGASPSGKDLLVVELNSGTRYGYEGVSEKEFDDFIHASSPGGHYNYFIKGKKAIVEGPFDMVERPTNKFDVVISKTVKKTERVNARDLEDALRKINQVLGDGEKVVAVTWQVDE